MKIIKNDEALRCSNSNKCKNIEYSFGDRDIDIGIAVITGRYPDTGFCTNLISKELIYIIEGEGQVFFLDKVIKFGVGDAILINNNEQYYWDTEYCKVAMSCTPAWSKEQYKLIKKKDKTI